MCVCVCVIQYIAAEMNKVVAAAEQVTKVHLNNPSYMQGVAASNAVKGGSERGISSVHHDFLFPIADVLYALGDFDFSSIKWMQHNVITQTAGIGLCTSGVMSSRKSAIRVVPPNMGDSPKSRFLFMRFVRPQDEYLALFHRRARWITARP